MHESDYGESCVIEARGRRSHRSCLLLDIWEPLQVSHPDIQVSSFNIHTAISKAAQALFPSIDTSEQSSCLGCVRDAMLQHLPLLDT